MPGERVLIVEDDELVAEHEARSLTSLGYRPLDSIDSGEAALIKAGKDRPDLVLMDIELAGTVDGVEAASAIYRELDIPTVFVTGFQDDRTFQRANTAEPFGYILKPFEAHELRNAIEIALRQHRARKSKEIKVLQETEMRSRLILCDAVSAILQARSSGEPVSTNPEAETTRVWLLCNELWKRSDTRNRALAHNSGASPPGTDLTEPNIPDGFQLQAYTKDGQTIWSSGQVRLFRDSGGNPLTYQGAVQHIER
jgi:DNA-binding response OmpR family regulator